MMALGKGGVISPPQVADAKQKLHIDLRGDLMFCLRKTEAVSGAQWHVKQQHNYTTKLFSLK